MPPTVFSTGKYRFFFFSREEKRLHVHVESADGEAKFWLEPTIALADHTGLRTKDLNEIQKIIEERQNEIIRRWKAHFEK